jgi:hypothetical protein
MREPARGRLRHDGEGEKAREGQRSAEDRRRALRRDLLAVFADLS